MYEFQHHLPFLVWSAQESDVCRISAHNKYWPMQRNSQIKHIFTTHILYNFRSTKTFILPFCLQLMGWRGIRQDTQREAGTQRDIKQTNRPVEGNSSSKTDPILSHCSGQSNSICIFSAHCCSAILYSLWDTFATLFPQIAKRATNCIRYCYTKSRTKKNCIVCHGSPGCGHSATKRNHFYIF